MQPEYKKCPTVADLERSLEQTKATFRPDEVCWWTNYIEQEKEERQRWQNLSREGKKHVCQLPMFDCKFSEKENEDADDEESKKRVMELEKLLEKSNTFPEVSI